MLLEPDNTQVIRETGEGREMRHLLANASLGRMMTGIANDEAGAGADAELRQHLSLPANYVPWHMICREPDRVGHDRRRGRERDPVDQHRLP